MSTPAVQNQMVPRLHRQAWYLVGGAPGSGKSLSTSHLAAELRDVVVLDKDVMCQPFVHALLRHEGSHIDDRESDIYNSRIRPLEYETMEAVALHNLSQGQSVITTAPHVREFRDPDWVRKVRLLARSEGAAARFFGVLAEPATARERIIRRMAGRDRWKLANWDSYLVRTPHEAPVGIEGIALLDNRESAKVDLVDQVRRLLGEVQEW